MKTWAVLSVAFFAISAFAGKAERELMNSKIKPLISEAEKAVKKSCGCNWKISVDESIGTYELISTLEYPINSIKEGAAKYCTDADSKKAVCKLSSLVYKKGATSEFTHRGPAGINTTDGQVVVDFEMMAKQLDQ